MYKISKSRSHGPEFHVCWPEVFAHEDMAHRFSIHKPKRWWTTPSPCDHASAYFLLLVHYLILTYRCAGIIAFTWRNGHGLSLVLSPLTIHSLPLSLRVTKDVFLYLRDLQGAGSYVFRCSFLQRKMRSRMQWGTLFLFPPCAQIILKDWVFTSLFQC